MILFILLTIFYFYENLPNLIYKKETFPSKEEDLSPINDESHPLSKMNEEYKNYELNLPQKEEIDGKIWYFQNSEDDSYTSIKCNQDLMLSASRKKTFVNKGFFSFFLFSLFFFLFSFFFFFFFDRLKI